MEGWQAWDVILRCSGQLRMGGLGIAGLDMEAALKVGEALGYDLHALAELLPSCENGMMEALNRKITKERN
ncbi:MAG: hypothetical protein PHD48_12385 [Alphaproteobacteria bacterium]|nr:hypothetical protein [Alphaproteobacteria bacterium]